jgi:hypothetical protein
MERLRLRVNPWAENGPETEFRQKLSPPKGDASRSAQLQNLESYIPSCLGTCLRWCYPD